MLDEIFTILDGLKNRPINYDDQLIRQIIERVTNTHLPCRLLENKKSLTKVRQSVKLRKLKFN